MDFLQGQEFTLTQPTGTNIVAFAVNFTDPKDWGKVPACMLEKIESVENVVEGRVEKTFSIPMADEEYYNVIVVTLAKSRCVIGYGWLENNNFVMNPETIQLKYLRNDSVENTEQEYVFAYNPNRQIALLDADSGEQVMPVVLNHNTNEKIKGKYKLVPNKRYIALEVGLSVIEQDVEPVSSGLADMML